jgi:hypothetical protein
MKRAMILAIAILLSATVTLAAVDVSGNWSGTFADETSTAPLLLILHQDGTKLTGTGGPTESRQTPVVNGKVEGDVISFQLFAGPSTLTLDLKIKGEEITGTVEVKREGQPVRIGKVALKRP